MSAIAPETINPFTLPFLPLSEISQLPNMPAVYLVLSTAHRKILYVGKSVNIRKRWQTHHLLAYLKIVMAEMVQIAWIEIDKTKSLSLTEKALIGYLKPELNTKSVNFRLSKKRAGFKNDNLEEQVHSDKQRRDTQGRFATDKEARLTNFTFRVDSALKEEVRQIAGDRMTQWLREAVIEKIAREKTAND